MEEMTSINALSLVLLRSDGADDEMRVGEMSNAVERVTICATMGFGGSFDGKLLVSYRK